MKWLWIFFLAISSSLCGEDVALWSGVTVVYFDTDHFRMTTFFDHRTSESLDVTEGTLLMQQFHYHAMKNLDLGVNFTLLRRSPLVNKYQQRLEFEVNPHWKICETSKLYVRNRFELRKTQGRSGDSSRVRQQVYFEWPTCWKGWTLYHSNELFYDLELDKFVQNRIVPLGIKYTLSDRSSIRGYYLLRRARFGDGWPSTHIIGFRLILGPLLTGCKKSGYTNRTV